MVRHALAFSVMVRYFGGFLRIADRERQKPERRSEIAPVNSGHMTSVK